MGELRGRLLLRLHRRGPGQDSVVEVIESFSVLARPDGVVGSPSEECMYTVTPLKCATSVSLGVKRAFVSVITPKALAPFSLPLDWTIGTPVDSRYRARRKLTAAPREPATGLTSVEILLDATGLETLPSVNEAFRRCR